MLALLGRPPPAQRAASSSQLPACFGSRCSGPLPWCGHFGNMQAARGRPAHACPACVRAGRARTCTRVGMHKLQTPPQVATWVSMHHCIPGVPLLHARRWTSRPSRSPPPPRPSLCCWSPWVGAALVSFFSFSAGVPGWVQQSGLQTAGVRPSRTGCGSLPRTVLAPWVAALGQGRRAKQGWHPLVERGGLDIDRGYEQRVACVPLLLSIPRQHCISTGRAALITHSGLSTPFP